MGIVDGDSSKLSITSDVHHTLLDIPNPQASSMIWEMLKFVQFLSDMPKCAFMMLSRSCVQSHPPSRSLCIPSHLQHKEVHILSSHQDRPCPFMQPMRMQWETEDARVGWARCSSFPPPSVRLPTVHSYAAHTTVNSALLHFNNNLQGFYII